MKSKKGIKVYCEDCQNFNAVSYWDPQSYRRCCEITHRWLSPSWGEIHYYDPRVLNACNDCKDYKRMKKVAK